MNPWDNSASASDDRRLDLLVDGELGEKERRDLLLQLDQEKGGWRRLALAFLEAQAWKQVMGSATDRGRQSPTTPTQVVAEQPAKSPIAIAATSRTTRRSSLPLGWLGTAVAMAASFLVTAGLGVLVMQNREQSSAPGVGTVATVDPAIQTQVSGERPWTSSAFPPGESAVASNSPKGPWRTVLVALPSGPQGSGETVELPAIERDRLDEAWLSGLPAALPPEVLGALSGRGYEVRQRRDLLPVNMQDGRGLVVPVDQVELRYVGGQKFQ